MLFSVWRSLTLKPGGQQYWNCFIIGCSSSPYRVWAKVVLIFAVFITLFGRRPSFSQVHEYFEVWVQSYQNPNAKLREFPFHLWKRPPSLNQTQKPSFSDPSTVSDPDVSPVSFSMQIILSFQLGPKPEARPAQNDLKIVQIFDMALRNNTSFVQVYISISICIHAWVVISFPCDKFWGGKWGILKWQLALWFSSEGRYCAPCISPFFLLGNKSLYVGPTPFSPSLLSADFLVTTHLAPKTISLSFLLTKLERKPGLTYFLPSPGTSLSTPKQWHLCRAPDQWTLSSGDFNHINTTAE